MSVDVERVGRSAVVRISRPDALNALDLEHASSLRELLEELAIDEGVRVVVLTGAGDRAFIAGADIKYMQGLTVLEARRWAELGHRCATLLETMAKPTIASINGFALGGGCELALACDLRLAASTARLGQPEITLGVIPGWGGTQRLARATTLGYAKEVVFTGRTIDAEEAHAHGLVNAVLDPAELYERTLELAAALSEKSPIALAAAKEATNLPLAGDHAQNLRHELQLFAALFSTEDQKEGMLAFAEKRAPRFAGR
jgi:enoyl-CoA hydratase